MFSEIAQAEIDRLIKLYPQKRSALIPMLLVAQKEHGWVKPEAMSYVAKRLDMSAAEVESIASFYTLLHLSKVGRHVIQVCTNLSCMLCGSDNIEQTLEKKLGIRCGETTPDGEFTLVEAECLGSCTTAPVIQINGEFKEKLNPSVIETLIDKLREH